MYILLITLLAVTGVDRMQVTYSVQHQVVGAEWHSRDACEEAARVVAANHREAILASDRLPGTTSNSGSFIRTNCILNHKK